jgi:hypothetical protein
MKEELSPKTYFWPYDVFGYLLPGMAVLVGLAAGNTWGQSILGPLWRGQRVSDLAIALGLAYVVGHIVAGMSSLILEKWIVSGFLKWPTAHMFRAGKEGKVSRVLLPSYKRPYSDEFQKAFDKRFTSTFGLPPKDPHDRFWLVWSFVALRHPIAYRRGTHFLELYGFSRNMSFALALIALFPFVPWWTATTGAWEWVSVLLVSSGFLFVNYTKLLRRLNDEVYRAFVSGLDK